MWPAALYETYLEREPASSWYRQHIRQALAFGVRAAICGTVALLWPLVLSLLIPNATAVIVFYVVAMIADTALFAIWLMRALAYSRRASRGETFALGSWAKNVQTRGIPAKH